ncbi:hypothetical protein CSUI_000503, partial [Cystoisospora suis]
PPPPSLCSFHVCNIRVRPPSRRRPKERVRGLVSSIHAQSKERASKYAL